MPWSCNYHPAPCTAATPHVFLQAREAGDSSAAPQNNAGDDPLYYETLETTMLFDTDRLHV